MSGEVSCSHEELTLELEQILCIGLHHMLYY